MKTKYTKCTPEILAKYLENIIKHGNVQMAAYLTNVGISSTYTWRKKYPQFDVAFHEAQKVYQAKTTEERLQRLVPIEWQGKNMTQLMAFDNEVTEPKETPDNGTIALIKPDFCKDCKFSRPRTYGGDDLLCYVEPFYSEDIGPLRPACRFYKQTKNNT